LSLIADDATKFARRSRATGAKQRTLDINASDGIYSAGLYDLLDSTSPLIGIFAIVAGSIPGFNFSVLYETNEVDLSLTAVAETPLPAALPLFATGLGALGLLGWRRKRKNA
jgi:hypothetical protein